MVQNRLFYRFATLMQVISAAILDFAFFYVSLYWVLYERNFRLFATLIIFYGVRAIHLNIFKLEFANKYYWDDPGFPAFVVKYGKYSDFFYSVFYIIYFRDMWDFWLFVLWKCENLEKSG